MANEIIYNPLLKKGFQELGDTAAQEAEMEDLRQKKITKFFAATDTLEPGEIAQYQGEDDSVNGLVNGYFYKKTGVPVVIAPPINEYQFTNDFPLNQPFVLGDYNFVFGNYYEVQNFNIQSSIISGITTHTYQNKYVALESIAVNTKVFNRALNRFEVVITVDNVNYIATTDQGSQIDISGVSSSSFTDLIEVGNADGTESFIFLSKQYGFYTLLVHWDFDNNNIIDWFPFQCLYDTRNTPYNFNTEQFQQVNAQPEPNTLPTGVILAYGGASAPTGFLLCDGAPVSRTDYADLFAAIGTAFGSGDGSTTFNLPDMREVVPVGAGTSTRAEIADHDTYNVGQFKDDQTQSHVHAVGIGTAQLGYVNSELVDISKYYRFQGSSSATTVKGGNLETVSESGRKDTTTHGKQLGVNYIIKY